MSVNKHKLSIQDQISSVNHNMTLLKEDMLRIRDKNTVLERDILRQGGQINDLQKSNLYLEKENICKNQRIMALEKENLRLEKENLRRDNKFELLCKHQSIYFTKKEKKHHDLEEETQDIGHKFFYSICSKNMWKKLSYLMIATYTLLSFVKIMSSDASTTDISHYLLFAMLVLIIFVGVLIPLMIFLYRGYTKKKTKTHLLYLFYFAFSPLKYLMPILLVAIGSNEMQKGLCLCLYRYFSLSKVQYENYFWSCILAVVLIVLSQLFLYSAYQFIEKLHPKWKKLEFAKVMSYYLPCSFLINVLPVVKIMEALSAKDFLEKEYHFLMSDILCISGVMFFLFLIIYIENHSVTKKYKNEYKDLFNES